MQIQITLVSTEGRRPLSILTEVESWDAFIANKDKYQQDAIVRILLKRGMSVRDAKQYGYTQIKARVYDRERIARENAERYAQIKKERGWE